jgi:signal transduction histidine kinase/DNA-binding response OmpR family regulator
MLIALLAAFASLCVPAWGGPVAVAPDADRIDLSERLALLRDPQRNLDPAEVMRRLDAFQPATRRDLVTSFNAGAFWLHISLQATGTLPLTRWLAVGGAKTQRVTLYLRQDDGLTALHSGRTVAVKDRPLVTMDPVFPVVLAPGEPREFLLRVDSRGATDMATILWEPQAYSQDAGKLQMQQAAILGGLLVSGALALLAFAALREDQYLWLGLFLTAIAGLEATRTNFLGTYLWPAALAQPAQVLTFFAVVAVFGLSKVVAHALELAQRMPRAHRLLIALRWIGVAGALLSVANYGHGVRVLSIVALVQNIATLALCGLAWARGQAAARLFLLAFSLALLTETARQLANLGLLPWSAAMDFSTFLFLLASPLILLGLVEQTRQLSMKLHGAEQLQLAKSAFLARVSHELRAPLNTILGFNRMLARRSEKLSLAEGTTEIEKSARRLLRLIDELLDEARAAAGQLTIAPAPLQLAPWLGEIARGATIAAEAKGNRLAFAFSGQVAVTIRADGERLRQVLENLLSNANRHTRQGTIAFTCIATVAGQEAILDFSVEDDGEGIESERLPLIFEPFVRGTPASLGNGPQEVGFGLGLPICRELLRQMGSDIVVASQRGKGSRFSFSLRCPTIVAQEPPPDRPIAQAATLPRVLLVDDDATQLGWLAEQLESCGFQVGVASGGRAAVELLGQADWDVVVTDQMMPEVDGWSVLRRARAAKPGLPVILLSAGSPCRPDDIPAGLQFDATLLKPASSEAVMTAMWAALLSIDAAGTAPPWETLAMLAADGDVSGIEDWIAAAREAAPARERTWRWIEDRLHRLDLSLLERFAATAGDGAAKPAAARA